MHLGNCKRTWWSHFVDSKWGSAIGLLIIAMWIIVMAVDAYRMPTIEESWSTGHRVVKGHDGNILTNADPDEVRANHVRVP